ncbi:MAG TPA: ABC transporter permease [Caproiciproducens sp.]|nr:ABC transporter permease [Caproiciproducens sp.]
MKWKDMLAMAVGNLLKRKVRTLLTVTGVVIGTCAIVVMLSFGIGLKQSMETMMQSMGDLSIITVNSQSKAPDSAVLDDRILKKIKSIKKVVALTPVYHMDSSNVTVQSGKYKFSGMIYGVDMQSLKELGYRAENGTLPAQGAKPSAILFGKDTVYDFMDSRKTNNNMIQPRRDKNGKMPEPYFDPMKAKLQVTVNLPENSTAKVKPVKLNCIGVLAEDQGKNPYPSHCVFMDVALAKELKTKYDKLNNVKQDKSVPSGYDSACVKAASVEDVDAVEETIKGYGFTTYSMESMRKPLEEQMRNIQMILGGLGAISLLVAALGITNTMIMSIYERTREIGIMKVLGCVVGNIRSMFLVEAGSIGFLGGVVGLALSYTISYFINTLASQGPKSGGDMGGMFPSGANISIIPPWLALGALAFATMVGLLSGLQPANRAVKISALTAIKQE